jgi:ubiquinone/menaquinone biosynthesis C-methylase UbiE
MNDHIRHDGDATDARVGACGRLVAPLAGRARRAHERMFGLASHAEWYDRVSGRLAGPLYRRISTDVAGAGLADGAFVLDVGTGPGRVPLLIAQRCPSLTVEGIDLSEQMIARATQTAGPATGGRVTYRVADVRALPYPDDSIDLVVSSLSLHHWTDVSAGVAEIRRVLRPDGRAWIYDARPVLHRVAENASPSTAPVTLEALHSEPTSRFLGRVWTAVAGRLITRLILTA